MRHKLLRSVLALLTFAITVQWSRVAQAAPLTITGTVGEIDINTLNNGAYAIVRFKLTNANATAACADYTLFNGQMIDFGVTAYAWFWDSAPYQNTGDIPYKEWYAALLYSKKGAPISCTVSNDSYGCHVTSCVLP